MRKNEAVFAIGEEYAIIIVKYNRNGERIMDLKTLQCFVAVAEQLNFSRAAKSLYLSQPSLSIRIKSLEEELNAPLFLRTHQQVYLTAEGAALLPEVRDILNRIDALPIFLQESLAAKTDAAASLVIALDPQEDRTELPVIDIALANFRKKNPHVSIEYISITDDNFEDLLTNNTVDICIKVLKPNEKLSSPFSAIPLLEEPIVLYAEDTNGVTASEIFATRELLILDSGDTWNKLCTNWLNAQKLRYTTRIVHSTRSLLLNIKSGSGAAFLPKTYAENLNKGNGTLYEIPIPNASACLTAIWNKYNVKEPIQIIVNELSAAVASHKR